ncbi:trace amine-associated receptor 13c-like [Liolophura sinensis]|uniref:trace amine-associated receptor 13c-like n=1 Tax=Liolophura sinensis TaxID=3198878 RepID=UPI003157F72C
MDNIISNCSFNRSELLQSEEALIPQTVRIVVILVVSVTVILTNLLNLIVLQKTRQIPPIAKICVLNLSVADLSSGVVCMLPCLVPAVTGSWPYGTIWCQIAGIFHGTCCSVSIWSLSVVSVDRYMAIKFPLRYHTLMTPRRCVTALLALWGLGVGTFLLPIFISEDLIYYEFSPATVICGMYWEYRWLCLVSGLYTPLPSAITIVFTSISVIREMGILSKIRVIPAGGESNAQKQDIRAINVLSATASVYFIAWGPYVVSEFTLIFTDSVTIPPGVQFSFMWLANSNSFMNVFIYSMVYKSFRVKTAQLIRSVLLCKFRGFHVSEENSSLEN